MNASPASAAPSLATFLNNLAGGGSSNADIAVSDPAAPATQPPWDFLDLLRLLQAPANPNGAPLPPGADPLPTTPQPAARDKHATEPVAAALVAAAPLVSTPAVPPPLEPLTSALAGHAPVHDSRGGVVPQVAAHGIEVDVPPILPAPTSPTPTAAAPIAFPHALRPDLPAAVASTPAGQAAPSTAAHVPSVPTFLAPAPNGAQPRHNAQVVTATPFFTNIVPPAAPEHAAAPALAPWQLLLPQDMPSEQSASSVPSIITQPNDSDHAPNNRDTRSPNADTTPMHASLIAGAAPAHDTDAAPTSTHAETAPANASLPLTAPTADGIAEGLHGHLDELRRSGRVDLHLELNPPELGRVRVQLAAHDHQVSLRLTVEGESARHAIETQADTLRHRLGELGVELGRFDVRRDGTGSSFAGRHDPPPEAPPPPPGDPAGRRRAARAVSVVSAVRAGVDLIA